MKISDSQSRLPKVLIVDLSKYYGGSTSRVLSQMVRAQPGTIELAALEGSFLVQEARKLGLQVHILGKSKMDPLILPRLTHLIRQHRFEVLDSQNVQSKFWASLAAILTDTPLISTIHSWYANEHGQSSIKGRLYTWLELITNRSLARYIAVSEKDRLSLIHSGVKEDIISLIYNAVELDPSTIRGDKEWLSSKFGIPPGSIVCTAVGRLVPVKGYDILIQAVGQVINQIPHLVCLIVGDGECQNELNLQIQKADLANHVFLVGYQDRETVLSILKASDIFAMPSRYEGTPIALLEAAALGLPILATSCGGIPELVSHEKDAILVPPEDSASLAQGLLRLSIDRHFAQTLGRNARLKAQQKFDTKSQVKATWDVYLKAYIMQRNQT